MIIKKRLKGYIMKKLVIVTCVLLLIALSLTGCNFVNGLKNSIDNPTSLAKTEEMITALAENRLNDAKALFHPDAEDVSVVALENLSSLLGGCKSTSILTESININTSFSLTGEKVTYEQATYTIILSDGKRLHASVVYQSDNVGAGFTTFRLAIGA